MGQTASNDVDARAEAAEEARREAARQRDALPEWTASLMREYLTSESEHAAYEPMSADMTVAQMTRALELTIAEGGAGEAADATLARLRRLLRASPSSASSAFFNQLFGGREPLAALADALVAVVNGSMYTLKAAGLHVLIEHEVLRRMARLVYPHAPPAAVDATFTPGGSLSNFVALVLARNRAYPTARDAGMARQQRPPRVYASAECHYSVRKACGLCGLGRDALRLIETDAATGRMRVDRLRAAMREDAAAGYALVAVVATAGTTVRGAFDPIDAIADACDADADADDGVWLHVDGAFGASMLLSPTRRDALLGGVRRAHSVAWDAHKMLGVPLTCAALLVSPARRGALRAALDEAASYLFQGAPTEEAALAPGRHSLQCGRRNDALKLWTAWQHLGDAGWARRIDMQFALRDYVLQLVEASPLLELVTRPQLLNVCFGVAGVDDAAELCRRLHATARVLVGSATVNARVIVRMAVVNPFLTKSDIDAAFEAIFLTAQEMIAAMATKGTATTAVAAAAEAAEE